MPLHLGVGKIGGVYKGTTRFSRIYHGADIVWDLYDEEPDTDGHRYWRLMDITSLGGNVTLAELKFYNLPGGDPLPYTATTKTTFGERYPSYMNDGNPATIWSSSGSGADWILMDFTIARRVFLIEGTIDNSSFGLNQGPRNFRLQWSDDGVNFTDLAGTVSQPLIVPQWTVQGSTKSLYDGRTYGKRFWRLMDITSPSAPPGGNVTLTELRVFENAGDTTPVPYTATSSAVFGSRTPNLLYDNNTSTLWTTAATGPGVFVNMDLADADVAQVARLDMTINLTAQAPTSFKVQVSVDGYNWTDVTTISGLSWSANNIMQSVYL